MPFDDEPQNSDGNVTVFIVNEGEEDETEELIETQDNFLDDPDLVFGKAYWVFLIDAATLVP